MEFAKFLLAKGADINIRRDEKPFTALEILLQHQDGLYPSREEMLRTLYKERVVETGLSQQDTSFLEEMKKCIGISSD